MFTLSELQSRHRATLAVVLLNAGLLACFFAILLRSPLKPWFAAVVVAGLAIYGIEMVAMLRARKRRALDWGMRYFLVALALLAPLCLLGLVLAWPSLPLTVFTGQLENLYGFLGFLGVISFAIIGMLYKIIPFLVWYSSYSRHIGTCKVPALADLYSPAVQAAGFWSYLLALGVTGTGIVLGHHLLVRVGCAALALSLFLLGWNVARMLRHLFRPQISAVIAQPATTSGS